VDAAGALALDGLPLDGFIAFAVAGLFGALWGSFFNVCIARVPLGQSVVSPGSHCFSCNAPVRAFDNIPILSYLLLRGRCRSCGARFSPRYALVEVLVAGISVLLWWRFGAHPPGGDDAALGLRVAQYMVGFAFAGVLVVLSFIDLDTKRLPDIITLPSIAIFFLAGLATGQVGWLDRLIGAAAGYGVIWTISTVYYYSTGREGLGLGDAKLLAVIGVVLGWRALPMVIFGASFVGIVISVPLLLLKQRGDKISAATMPAVAPDPASATNTPADAADAAGPSIRRAEVPFGPFLALAALVYLFAGEQIWAAFLTRLGGGELP
jgi:leader peptidase (prepilin peptidase)/N-methyltransferase